MLEVVVEVQVILVSQELLVVLVVLVEEEMVRQMVMVQMEQRI
jgi:hypothetical protein